MNDGGGHIVARSIVEAAGGRIMRRWWLLCTVMLLPPVSPALAKGKHVTCELSGVVNDGAAKKPIKHTLKFYLDDTNEKLVGEGGKAVEWTNLNVRTTMYSDVEVKAEISTGLGVNLMFFGLVTNGHMVIGIDRVTGSAALAGELLPRGVLVEAGSCHEITPPATKF